MGLCVLTVSDVIYQVCRVVLNTGQRMFCVWLSLDPHYSVNYSQSFRHADIVQLTPSSAVSKSANNSANVCFSQS